MNEPDTGMSCALGCWALAAGAGLLAFILLMVLGDQRLMGSIFMSGVVFIAIGLLSSWIFCGELPKPAVGPMADTNAAPSASGSASAHSGAAASAAATPAATAKSAPVDAAAAVKPSKALAGEADLDARKGSWKYGEDDKKAAPKAAPKKAAAKADAAPAAEGAGTKPMTYDAPPKSGADDLKRIKGIGPKMEKMCNSLGFYTFEQISKWSPEEVAWVDQNLEGFKGRVTRDTWVDQAKLLASGADTEFSKRVDKGGVY